MPQRGNEPMTSCCGLSKGRLLLYEGQTRRQQASQSANRTHGKLSVELLRGSSWYFTGTLFACPKSANVPCLVGVYWEQRHFDCPLVQLPLSAPVCQPTVLGGQ